MAQPLAAGALTQNSVQSNKATLSSAVATGGTGPYTYQWYKSTDPGFTAGPSNLIAGATNLQLIDTGLIPNTTYHYQVIATDAVAAPASSSKLTVVTSAQDINQNQFAPVPYVGMTDQRYAQNTRECQIDFTQVGTVKAGQAVKIVDNAGGEPKVVAQDSITNDTYGFITFNGKDLAYKAGDKVNVARRESTIWLMPTANGARGVRGILDLATVGGVTPVLGSGSADIVVEFYDKPVAGTPARCIVLATSWTKDA